MKKLLAAALAVSSFTGTANAVTFVNALEVRNGTDFSGLPAGVNGNRFGGFGSDLVHRGSEYFGMTDRGPGGGLLSYAPRIQVFSLDTSAASGSISNFALKRTIVFTQADGVTPFNGQNPQLLNGNKGQLGASFDPEGMVIRDNGNFLVADEYGPSLYEFDANGRFLKSFAPPANLIPKEASGAVNYVDGRPTITSGRQDNRGFEGLTLSNDGTKAYAILQDPLVNEGANGDGRRGRFVRMVEFDLATGASKQFAYQLEGIADINTRTNTPFTATNQGRSIGVSAIYALPNGKFLVLERDNRGLGVDPATALLQSGTKRVYVIDINGATDISGVTLTNGALPPGAQAVTKTAAPFLDILAAVGNQATIAEKFEGLSFGDRLADGGVNLVLITDNDFSVTQVNGPEQFDVCTNGTVFENVALDAACSSGLSTIPTYLYSFRLSGAEAQAFGFGAIPEPATWAMMIAGFGLVGGSVRRRNRAHKSVTN
jgi:Esterase-like activity of phytase/PEP-CTERM motif